MPEEAVELKLVFPTNEDLRLQFGRVPTFESLFVPVTEPRSEGFLVELRLILPEPWGELTAAARVVAAAPTPSTPATPYRLQLKLLPLERTKQARLRALINDEVPPPLQTEEPRTPPPPKAEEVRVPPPPPAPPPPPPAPPSKVEEARPPAPPAAPPPVAVPVAKRPEPEAEPTELKLDLEEMLRPFERATASTAEDEDLEVQEAEPPRAPERQPEEVAQLLTGFAMKLTKAITASSYYEADHQATAQAKVGLYDTFRLLVRGSPEVTFLAHVSDAKSSILVYGLFDEPMALERAMLVGQAEVFVPKLAGYFEAKGLLSISFKQSLDHAEFNRFVDLLASPAHLARNDPKYVVSLLTAQQIQNISVVFKEDLIAKRRLSWRVVIALTRLKRDLSVLPLYQGLSRPELGKIRLQVFKDVVRPIRQVPLIQELLMNCDLVAQELKDLPQEEMELLVQDAVTPEALPELLAGLTHELIEAARHREQRSERLLRLTRNLARKLARSQRDVKQMVFRQLYENEVLQLEELPARLRDKFRIERRVDIFLKGWKSHIPLFDLVSSAPVYKQHLAFFHLVFPELISRHEHEVTVKIALLVAQHKVVSEAFEGRQALAGAWLAGLGSSEAAHEIVRQLLSADRLRRKSLLTLCGILGEAGIPILFKALSECPTRSARQELCDLLGALKEPTARFLVSELEKPNHPWYFQRNLLDLLGRVADASALALVSLFITDPHPRVRLQALLTASALDPRGGERILLRGLGDDDADIRDACLRQLIQRRSPARDLFDYARAVLTRRDDVNAARQICHLLTTYQEGEGYEQAVDVLLEVLRDEEKKGFWSLLKNNPEALDDVKVAACQALGRLRAKRAVPVLSELSGGRNKTLRQSAAHALRFIHTP